MRIRTGFIAAIAAATVVLPLVLLAAPAEALSASTTTVADNAGSVVTGGTLVFTANVTGPGGTPAGSIDWTGSTCTSTTPLTDGVATCSISNAQASSSYSVTAAFTDGDGNYTDSSDSDGPVSPGVASSTTTVADNAGSVVTGGTLVFTANVTGPGGTPAGSIDWTGSTCTSTTPLTDGVATCSISNAQASSSYSVTAAFTDGDGNYTDSSDSDGPVSPGVADQATLTVTSTSGTFATPLTLTTSGGSGTGAVTYALDGGSTATGCAISTGQLTSTSAGTCVVTATKAADTNYNVISSVPTTITLAPASSTTTVADNTGSVVTGGTLVFTANVTGPGGTPAGSIDWTGSTCTSTTPLTDGVATCSISNAQASSSYSVTAAFTDGDGNYTDSSDSDGPVSPGVADQATLAVTSTSGTFATPLTLTTSGGSGTGAVTYALDGGSTATGCAVSTGQLTSTSAGTCVVTATKAADTNYNVISSVPTTITLAPASSTTTVADNAGSVVTGGTLVFTANVTGPGGTPAGSIDWTGSTCTSTTPLTDGVATCSISNAQASSSYSVTAAFTDGDGNYTDSSDSDGPVSPGVASSTTTVADNAGSVVTGGTLVFTANVTGPGGTPAGSIDWTGSTCTSTTPLTDGVATCSISNAQASSSYSVTAAFTDGDGNYTDSSDSDGPVSPGVADQATLTVTSTSGTFATPLTLTTSGGSGTGAVTYALDGGSTATGCAISTGQLTSTSAGTCVVTATKAADTNYNVISSVPTTITLAPASSTTTVADNTGSVVTGGTLVFTANVTGPGGTPAGSIDWTGSTCTSTTPLTDGVATCSISNAQASSSYSVTAAFTDGDGNYTDSSGSDGPVSPAKAHSTAPTITNLPTSGTFGGGFTAIVSTDGDGTTSVTSSTPGVCTTRGLSVSYVGVGTCSLTVQVAAGPNYLGGSAAAPSFTVGRADPSNPTITNTPSPANEFFGFTAVISTTGDGTTSVTSNTPAVCSVGSNGLTVTFVGFGSCSLTPSVSQGTNYLGGSGSPQIFTVNEASHGYWLVGSDGGIFSFGTAAFHGSMGGIPLQRPVVGITPTSTGNGYWLVASDGGLFSFGDSTYYGSLPGLGFHPAGAGLPQSLNAPIVGMVPTSTGQGYFMIASDGGVFAFGDARFEGSCPGIGGCAGAAVAVVPDHTGKGYWLVTNTGGVYAFGDASFYGAPPASSVSVVDAVATPDGHGYWLLYANGVVDPFGDAGRFGNPAGYVNVFNPATAIFRTSDGQGYWVAAARGDVFSYGDAPYLGGMAAAGLDGQIIAGFGF